MSESNWGKWVIVGLVAIDFVLAASTIGHEINKTPTYYYAADQERSEPTLGSARIPTPAAEPRPERKEWREEQDLYAQRDMAKWALWMFIVSTAGVVVGAFGLYFLKRTLDETSAMTLATREIGENQTKAYISLTKAFIVLEDAPINSLSLRVEIKNDGATPAKNVAYGYCVLVGGITRETIVSVVDKPYWRQCGAIAPGDTTKDTFTIPGILSAAQEYQRQIKQWNDDNCASDWPCFFFEGAVIYDDVFGKSYESKFRISMPGGLRRGEKSREIIVETDSDLVLFHPLKVRPDHNQQS